MQIGFVFVCLLAEHRILSHWSNCSWPSPEDGRWNLLDSRFWSEKESVGQTNCLSAAGGALIWCATQPALKYRYLSKAAKQDDCLWSCLAFAIPCFCVCVCVCMWATVDVSVSGQIFGHMRRMSNAMMECDGSFPSRLLRFRKELLQISVAYSAALVVCLSVCVRVSCLCLQVWVIASVAWDKWALNRERLLSS